MSHRTEETNHDDELEKFISEGDKAIGNKAIKSRFSDLGSLRTQIAAATAVSFGFFTCGMVRAWASPAIPSMQGDGGSGGNYSLSYAPLSKEEISWISSLTPLGALTGSLMSSFPLSRFGRKKTLLFSGALFLFAFILLGTCKETESMIAILVSRGILGFANGLSIPAAQIYVSECTESHVRGTLGSLPALFMSLGTLLCYIVGAFLPWHFLSYFCAAFPVLMLAFIALLPESPAWLMTNGREDDARKSLTWLRGGKDVLDELSKISENIQRSAAQATGSATSLRSLLKRPVLVPLFLSMSLMFFQQWCGVNAVIFYTVTIFSEAGSSIEKNLATVIVGIVQFFATFISLFLVDKAGRRILLLTSGVIMTASLAAVGAFFYMKAQNEHHGLEFLPLLGLVVFMIGYSIGFASVPFVLMGELFPNQYRNLLGAISSCFNLTNTFLVIKLFTNISSGVGLYGVFWIYASVSLLSCIFVIVFLPETKGKSLEEIEAFFRKTNEVSSSSSSSNNNEKLPVEMKYIIKTKPNTSEDP